MHIHILWYIRTCGHGADTPTGCAGKKSSEGCQGAYFAVTRDDAV
jgi:hypothetical protein